MVERCCEFIIPVPMTYETVVYRRVELYDRVWAKPVRDVAKSYGVSDVALAKMCGRLNVPVPGRGYWARLGAGQLPPRIPLPPLKKGERAEVEVRRSRASRMRMESKGGRWLQDTAEPQEEPIRVTSHLDDPHELIARSVPHLRKTKAGADGIARCWDRECVAIEVTPGLLDRALCIMDALMKALATRGVDVAVLEPKTIGVWSPSYTRRDVTMPVTVVVFDGESIPVLIEETTEIVQTSKGDPARWRVAASERRPTAKLRLRIRDDLDPYRVRASVQKNWTDTTKRPIERCLNALIREMGMISVAMKEERIESERRERDQAAARHRLQLERNRKELEERRRGQIKDEVSRWRVARDIRDYVAESRSVIARAGVTIKSGGEIDEWLRWCDHYATAMDPLTALDQEIASAQ